MGDANYYSLVDRISRASGLSKEEIEGKVHQKREKISGLISKEGAAQIIAAELGIRLDGERVKIKEILSGMKRVNVVGKVVNIFPVRNFTRNSQESKVANLVIADETSNIKVVLWDLNHIGLIETGQVSEGSIIEITNASTRGSEIHLGSFSELKSSDETISQIVTEKVYVEKKINDFEVSDNVQTRAFVVQVFEPRFFNVCPECKKKIVPAGDAFLCGEHGKILPEKRALMNIVIDDGAATIRAVLFHEKLSEFGVENPESISEEKKKSFLGKEMIFSGSVKLNKFFNNLEFTLESVKEVDVDQLISRLETK
ncbi:MAG TPA: hypothetical protein VJZ93_02880 [Candidatus Nanoarchaeia archaeon]|nr:hypothetical protein [Candidatus Nanoarchaeia archaeon]